jgi:hypothetical protein
MKGKYMKEYKRDNRYFSLCGLNCSLCVMFIGKYCPGCGMGNKPCKIARCAMERERVAYCFSCKEYPCTIYEKIDDYDSFISHFHQKKDLKKAGSIGIENYIAEQKEKEQILQILLDEYNDGRKKSLFCTAVNLLELVELKRLIHFLEEQDSSLSIKEKSSLAAGKIKEFAEKNGIDLTLRKKEKRKS